MAETNRDLLIELLEELEAKRLEINGAFLTCKASGLKVDIWDLKILKPPTEKCNECKKKVKEWYRNWHNTEEGDEYSFFYCRECFPKHWGDFDKKKEKWWSEDKFLSKNDRS